MSCRQTGEVSAYYVVNVAEGMEGRTQGILTRANHKSTTVGWKERNVALRCRTISLVKQQPDDMGC